MHFCQKSSHICMNALPRWWEQSHWRDAEEQRQHERCYSSHWTSRDWSWRSGVWPHEVGYSRTEVAMGDLHANTHATDTHIFMRICISYHICYYYYYYYYIYIYTCPCVHVSSWAGWKYAHVLSVHRCTAQADEDTRHWALQPLDDVGLQDWLFLPSWMSLEVELKICQFIEQNASWQARIDKRSSEGKELTQTQQSRYDAWLLGCEPRLVFSKERQKLVTDAGQIKDDCICLTLHLSDDPDKLLVTSSAGKEYRLVLLKGSKSEEDAGLEARIAFDFFLFCVHIIYIYTYTYICIYIYILCFSSLGVCT